MEFCGRRSVRWSRSWRISNPFSRRGSARVGFLPLRLLDVPRQMAVAIASRKALDLVRFARRPAVPRVPSGRLRTQPVTSKPAAICLTEYRKPTPCTRPA